jgi:hypothetical protein
MKPADIHRQLCEVYEEHAMSDSMVWRWVRYFNEAKMCMIICRAADCLWLMNFWHAVEEKIQENRFTILSL